MKTILEEIIDFQTSELIAGRNPKSMKLNEDQHRRLKEWCDATTQTFITPQGNLRVNNGITYERGRMTICGMLML